MSEREKLIFFNTNNRPMRGKMTSFTTAEFRAAEPSLPLNTCNT